MTSIYDIAGYVRISVDDEQSKDNVSIENQKAIIADYVKTAVKLLLEDDHLHCLQDYVLQNQEEEMKMNICKRNEESGNGGYCS